MTETPIGGLPDDPEDDYEIEDEEDDDCDLEDGTCEHCGGDGSIACDSWVNWHYRFGQCNRSNWIDSRCHCLFYIQSLAKERCAWTWNPEEVLVDSDRKAVYNDKRVDDYERGGKRLPGTVWGIPSDGKFWGRVQGTNEERRPNHPNQLPEVYLARVLKAYTNVGDVVLEPFGGSGTLSVVAAAIGRYATVIDVSEANCASIVERLRKGAVRV